MNEFSDGIYCCRQCGAALFTSGSKFHSESGWPSFDSAMQSAVERRPDPDGERTEIVCAICKGHLGHVFGGEDLTPASVRHCVNSVSLVFLPADRIEKVVFAAGCFWGVEYRFQQVEGVLKTTVGYTAGFTDNPTYREVCTGTTGHAESVEIIFDKSVIPFDELAKLFFEIHDPTTADRQGVDIGTQYRSAVFFNSDEQKGILENLVAILEERGYDIVTQIEPLDDFHSAQDYHQNYYRRNGIINSDHVRTNRFDD